MSMRVLGPNLEDFGPKLEQNKPFELLKNNVSFAFNRPSTVLHFYSNRKDFFQIHETLQHLSSL